MLDDFEKDPESHGGPPDILVRPMVPRTVCTQPSAVLWLQPGRDLM